MANKNDLKHILEFARLGLYYSWEQIAEDLDLSDEDLERLQFVLDDLWTDAVNGQNQ